MTYTIEQLLNMDFTDMSKQELQSINAHISENYHTDARYTELLEEVRFALELLEDQEEPQ